MSLDHEILAAAVTVENQAAAMRRHDLETAQRIINQHPIMHGIGMPVEDVAQARVAIWHEISPTPSPPNGWGVLNVTPESRGHN